LILSGANFIDKINKDRYWQLKRDCQPLSALLGASGSRHIHAEAYRACWLDRIESPEYLQYDIVIPGARHPLETLRRRHDLVVVTLRQRRDHLKAQLEQLGLRPFFAGVLCASPTAADGWETKQRLIRESGFLSEDALIVGDTEMDIRAGKSLGITKVAVLSGIRSQEHLVRECQDVIVEDIRALPQVLDTIIKE